MGNLIVYTIKNSPIDSNCYIVLNENSRNAVIIDPGTKNMQLRFPGLNGKGFVLDYLFMTHEHFDHIAGVDSLKANYSCLTVCSAVCSGNISDRKKNLSVFYDQVGFECSPADIIFIDRMDLKWNDYTISLHQTKGHSEGGMIIKIENLLFTGDTVIKGKKTVVKLPDSDKEDLIRSIDIISTFLDKKTMIYPGHGESFSINEFNKAHYF